MAIFGIGTVVVDHVVQLPCHPTSDTKVEVLEDWRQVGGPVPVALSTAVFYGSQVSFLGRWATDEPGRFIQQTLADRGIRLCDCTPGSDWASGFAHVWVDSSTGERTIAYSRGKFPLPDESDVRNSEIAGHQILHLDGWAVSAAIKAAKTVHSNGGTIVLDAGSMKPGMDELLPHVDILIASSLFRHSHFGREDVSDEKLLSLGPDNVITTQGAGGAKWIHRDWQIQEPAICVEVVDTNGAGDIFCGAVLNALERKLQPSEILKFANQVAGYACGRRGNSQLPELSQLKQDH